MMTSVAASVGYDVFRRIVAAVYMIAVLGIVVAVRLLGVE